ncbi:MAG: dUTPase, partial [Verrucomicrobia bacterium]|nr:dUTPase [Verrucomicrobiota bacterium]
MQHRDWLEEMFEKQALFNERIGLNCAELDDEGRRRWLLNYCRAMSQEIAELTDCVPWKWWAKYQKFDLQNARVEVVDLFHFLISAAEVLGLTARDVHNLYLQKNKVNFRRQDAGYTDKDEKDNQSVK